jgi:hypothetical protein
MSAPVTAWLATSTAISAVIQISAEEWPVAMLDTATNPRRRATPADSQRLCTKEFIKSS